MNPAGFLSFLLYVIPLIFLIICLVRVLMDLKSQWNNPYTRVDFFLEFTITRKIQMLFTLISLISLIVGIFSPAFRVGGSLLDNNVSIDGKSVIELVGKNSDTYSWSLFIIFSIGSLIFCIIGLRITNKAFYLPLIASQFSTLCLIGALSNQMSSVDFGVASGGVYGGVGFYALIVSAISAVGVFIALLFKDRKRLAEQPTTR